MADYLRIARAYLCGTSVTVWCFMLLCLLTFAAVGEELARNQGGILGGVLSRKSYLAMFAYFNACVLGVLLRDNIAQPWASLLPHYRKKHLLVTTLIALIFLGLPMFSMEFVGTSDIALSSVAVIFMSCLAAGLWTLHHPALGVLAFPFLFFAMADSAASPGLAAFLAGARPSVSAALVLLSLIGLWAFAWRLLAWNEEKFEYAVARMWGDLLRGRGGQTSGGLFNAKSVEGSLTALPPNERAAMQNVDQAKSPFFNLRQVDELTGYNERNLWQRSLLWRHGTGPMRTSASVGYLMVITLIMIAPMVFVPSLVGAVNPARDVVVIMSVQVMTNPVTLWLPWLMRLPRLGYESVRPRTRREFVRELGLAFLWDVVQCWVGGVLLMGIAAAIWAPELLQVNKIFPFICCTAVGQLCAYGMMAVWLVKLVKRGLLASVACAFCPFLAMASWILFVVMNNSIGFEVNIVIASVLAVASMALIALAHRRWCRADFD